MRHAVALAATLALAVLAVLVVPRRTVAQVERLRLALETDPRARVRFYRRFAVSGALVVAVCAVVVAASGVPVRDLGLRWPNDTWFAASLGSVAGAVVAILLAAQVAGVERVATERRTATVRVLMPDTREERREWPLVAVAAGVSEEALYRGLFVLHLHALVPSLRLLPLAFVAAVAFGMGHRYQGWFGVVATGLLGAGFGVATVVTRSLLPAIVMHAVWDLVTGWQARRAVEEAPPAGG